MLIVIVQRVDFTRILKPCEFVPNEALMPYLNAQIYVKLREYETLIHKIVISLIYHTLYSVS